MLNSLDRQRDSALLLLRVLLGVTLVFAHGLPKVLAPDRWEATGRAMQAIGIGFAPVFWGFMAGATELAAGTLGGGRAHPIDAAAGYIVLVMLGAGSNSLDRRLGFDRPGAADARPTAVNV